MAMTNTGTLTLEVTPVSDQWHVNLWVGTEFTKVQWAGTQEAAMYLAQGLASRLRALMCAAVVVIGRDVPAPAAGPQPDMFPIKP